jgi:DNA-binding beta-propeller fold protein YncE
MQKTLLSMLVACVLIGAGMTAQAGQATGYIERYVFVPSAVNSTTTIIDTDTDRISGTLQIDFVPRQVEVSRELAKLVATDGGAAITVLGVFGGLPKQIALPNPVQRLVLGTRGRMVAAIDLAGGAIALVDLDTDRVTAAIGGLPPLRDVIFGNQDAMIYIATEGRAGIGVIDVTSGQLVREIAVAPSGGTGIATLTRTPDDRRLLLQSQGGGPIDVLDLGKGGIDRIDVAAGAGPAVPSGTGTILLIPDGVRQTLVVRSERLGEPVTLRGAAVVTGIYTAWLDSVGFVASAALRRLLVYDLDRPSLVGEIALAGVPVRGAVTVDSRKLYLPVTEPPQLVVVDGKSQRVVATIDLPGKPLAAIVAGGWGVCH